MRIKRFPFTSVLVASFVFSTACYGENHLYWGDLHGHTQLSDGWGSPFMYYLYSRDSSKLDFAAITDHDYIHGKDLRGYPWSQVLGAANAFSMDGRFITIPGYEWSSDYYGHLVVLYSDDTIPLFSYQDTLSDNPIKLLHLLGRYGNRAVCNRAHPMSYPASNWVWDGDLLTGMEMVGFGSSSSGIGVYEYEGCSNGPSYFEPGSFVQDILEYGYRLALTGVKDSHDGRPGKAGLTAVYADTLTREALFNALRKRHCYATTGARIRLEFSANDSMMGSQLRLGPLDYISLHATVGAPKKILGVEIVKNNRVAYAITNNDTLIDFSWIDNDTVKAGYYYARVTLVDGQMAFASPIWFKKSDRLPSPVVQMRPRDNSTIYSNRIVYNWVPSKDPDFADLSIYYIECQQLSGETTTYNYGPLFMNWFEAPDSYPEGSYRWRVVTKTRQESSATVVSGWSSFRCNPISVNTEEIKLIYAYPNPFEEKANVMLYVPKADNRVSVQVKIYDILGRLVKTLANREYPNGIFVLSWNGRNSTGAKCGPGMYFITATCPPGITRTTIKIVKF